MVDNERMDKLARSFFEDHDHGREAMQNASVTENICFIYFQNTAFLFNTFIFILMVKLAYSF